MTRKIHAIVLAAALMVPPVCPLMAMAPVHGDAGMDAVPSTHVVHAGWAMSTAFSERVSSDTPSCCPVAHEMMAEDRPTTIPNTDISVCSFLLAPCDVAVTCEGADPVIPRDSVGPPLTFEQRSVTRRE